MSGMNKAERLNEMKRLYMQRAYSDIQLAERLGVSRETVFRDRVALTEEEHYPIEKNADGLYFMNRSKLLSEIKVSLHEALALYLSARKTSRQTHFRHTHAISAMEKLSAILYKPMAEKLLKATDASLQQEENPEWIKIIENVTQAWAEQREVRIEYQALGRDKIVKHTLRPYLIEPSIWSDSIYVIAYSDRMKTVAPFKIERIKYTFLSGATFELPADFDEEALLKHAWGIWYQDKDPVAVRLRFNKKAAQRVKESKWHPLEKVKNQEDGGCIWQADLAEWQEMLPWVRGWGADVEVLAPEGLRKALIREARLLVGLYGVDEDSRKMAIAHTINNEGKRHSLVKHLQAVGKLAQEFAVPLHAPEIARYLGLWHDLGKFNPDFQQYLFNAEKGIKRRGPDHKATGVRIAFENNLDPFAFLLQGHHGGLKNQDDLNRWYAKHKDKTEEVIELAREVIEFTPRSTLPLPAFIQKNKLSAEFFLRMLFSALVDADFLDTERHFNQEKSSHRGSDINIGTLWQRFEANQVEQFGNTKTEKLSQVNRSRHKIYNACLEAAQQQSGLFRLEVPTGGGKTRSGMAFALRHAIKNKQQRIIVAVPYITITQQTASTYREIFEKPEDHTITVLEHHSSVNVTTNDKDKYDPAMIQQRLAAENWDTPVIVTTTVQLFESLFANSTSQCRKLHRLANSVIILDEAQSLPANLLDPMLDALKELSTHYGSTVVLSTATQPAFDYFKPFKDLEAKEIIPNSKNHFDVLKRVEYEWKIKEPLTWEEIADLMRTEKQSLAICNRKQDAIDLLEALNDKDALHLSTLLCGKHRSAVIEKVRQRLKSDEPCQLVATQVVEAGVDIDFPLVLRALGPLDSIVQAAGRANREGKLEQGRVIVFTPKDGGLPPGAYNRATETTLTLLNKKSIDMNDPSIMQEYFTKIYQQEDSPSSDGKIIQKKRKEFDYPEVSRKFKLIKEETFNVVITDYGSKKQVRTILDRLHSGMPPTRDIMRQLQPYMVSIRQSKESEYRENGLIIPFGSGDNQIPGIWEWTGKYDETRGLAEVVKDAENYIVS